MIIRDSESVPHIPKTTHFQELEPEQDRHTHTQIRPNTLPRRIRGWSECGCVHSARPTTA